MTKLDLLFSFTLICFIGNIFALLVLLIEPKILWNGFRNLTVGQLIVWPFIIPAALVVLFANVMEYVVNKTSPFFKYKLFNRGDV